MVYIKNIHLEWYRIFLHTAQERNLTKAAQKLHITQPSVSYAIKQIEEALGVVLFQRLSKGVELTDEGRSLLAYVEQSFALLHAAERHAEDLKSLTDGELRIGASDSLIKHLLLPYLNRYHQQYPGIRIRLSHGKTPDLTARLKEGLIDCAIIHLPVEEPQLIVKALVSLQDCFVVGEALRRAGDSPLSAGELNKLPLLLLSAGSSTRQFVERWMAGHGLEVKPDMELGSVELLAEFAELGYGAAFITRSFVEEKVRDGKLFELRLQDELPPRSIGYAVRKERKLSLAAEQFVAMLGEPGRG
ncbi:LysR family transcriptional regulator [Paenibacillus sp. HB172176]|uniref:LysR family transcriptional regulator n=1 Tax=Paenibacillus sp. HB172176 TaxID=2493690 RepID=UPI001F0FB649|nr:LysR family transcriptional regulator [Paenibacillus sp. HB172176]